MKKPYTKLLNNTDMMRELSFYDKLYTVKTSKALKRYACSYSL